MTRPSLPIRREKHLPDKQRPHERKYKSGKIAIINPDNKVITVKRPSIPPLSTKFMRPKPSMLQLRPPKPMPKIQARKPEEFKLTGNDVVELFRKSDNPNTQDIFNFVNVNVEDFWYGVAEVVSDAGLNKFTSQKEFDAMISKPAGFNSDIIERVWDNISSFDEMGSTQVESFGPTTSLGGLERRIFDECREPCDLTYFHDPLEGKLFKSSMMGWEGGPTKDFEHIFQSSRFHHPEEMGRGSEEKTKANIIKVADALEKENVPFLFVTESYNSSITIPKSQHEHADKVIKELKKQGKLQANKD